MTGETYEGRPVIRWGPPPATEPPATPEPPPRRRDRGHARGCERPGWYPSDLNDGTPVMRCRGKHCNAMRATDPHQRAAARALDDQENR